MKYSKIKEEELKNKIAKDYFWNYDCTKIIGNIDFCVCMNHSDSQLFEQSALIWAEAKTGTPDIYESFVQLILTIGKERTFDKFMPPNYLGAFDYKKIAFIPYSEIVEIFYINDFNWNITPSNHNTKEFQQIYSKVEEILNKNTLMYDYIRDERELITFIRNLAKGKFGQNKFRIDKNNFMVIYNKWLQSVKPSIAVDWELLKNAGIIDGDFYLADILSQENKTLKEKLFVLLKYDRYELDRKIDEAGLFSSKEASFKDGQKAHTQFWNRYERPPKAEYWDYIVERRDLLVPQDVRERKGSYFTPQIWVELSQQYLADTLGEDWQEEYYVWDCAAGTGNLLAGLTDKYRIWASTLDKADVDVMHDRIKNGANLLKEHVFQFDFLNDDFSKLPKSLLDIINNPEERKKLIIYINPPYAEATSAKTVAGTGKNKAKVAIENKVYEKYKAKIGKASNELFAQFFARISDEIRGAKLAQFSKLKILQAQNFSNFRNFFNSKLLKMFIVPAKSFDNVKGEFPIGFFIWDTNEKWELTNVKADVYDMNGEFIGKKNIFCSNKQKSINQWIKLFDDKTKNGFGFLGNPSPDFQHNSQMYLSQKVGIEHFNFWNFTQNNIIHGCVYFAVRQCIEATWLNDRDQFLYPKDGWQTDTEFQSDCLAFTLFHGQNRISSKEGTNYWIPFSEQEVDAREKFESDFMYKFINGKIQVKSASQEQLSFFQKSTSSQNKKSSALKFSKEAEAVFDAGRELWRYYHAQPNCSVNASYYDIREHFQGRNEKGRMNSSSTDEQYNNLVGDLREKLKQLAEKIEPKVYEYGFLKK
jgi:hypothetical protein